MNRMNVRIKPEWNELMVTTVLETEKSLPLKHLIAQNVAFQKAQIKGLNPAVSVLNFHAATPECVEFNYPLNRVIAFDETGGADRSDRKYRTEGWEFMLSGGGVYSHLDFHSHPIMKTAQPCRCLQELPEEAVRNCGAS